MGPLFSFQSLALALSLASPGVRQSPETAQAAESDGTTSLFDGTSLNGWIGDERYWSVRDGAIVGAIDADDPLEQNTCLVYDGAAYADFELTLEFRLEGANSGVQFRSHRVGTYSLLGYQADLDDRGGHTGAIYEEYGRGFLARRGERLAPSGDDTPLAPLDAASDAWRSLRIRAQGSTLEVWIDDVPTASYREGDRRRASSYGAIGLELHAGDAGRVAFRELRVRDLGGRFDETPLLYPVWLWSNPTPEPREEAWFTKRFVVDGPFAGARLHGSSDDRMEVYLNGALVAEWETPEYRFDLDVRGALRRGENVFEVWCANETADAAFWLELRVVGGGVPVRRVGTDLSWRARSDAPPLAADDDAAPARVWRFDPEDEAWHEPFGFGPLGIGPWNQPRPSTRGAASAPTGVDNVTLPAGFRAELVYAVSRARMGSWISLAFDSKGRIVASDQIGQLYRVTLPTAPGGEPAVERIDVDIGAAHGLHVGAHDDLLLVVNDPMERWESGVVRVTDADGDDHYDRVERLLDLPGRGEHGPHAIVPASDGASFFLASGNHTGLPDAARLRVPLASDDDAVLPAEPDPNGHPAPPFASGGWIARFRPDTRSLDVLATGLRNVFDLAVVPTAAGDELLVVDSDMEWDLGMPWYRPPRLLHVLEGADYGWRYGTGKLDDDRPDAVPPVIALGPGSPTGLLRSWELNFPPRYDDALFVADWAYGRVDAIFLAPSASGFTGEVETFLLGTKLPICDMVAGPDGALWFVTGGRGLDSAIYRVAYDAGEPEASDAKARTAFGDDWTAAVARRRALRDAGGVDAAELVDALGSDDPLVRHAARRALEQRLARGARGWIAPFLDDALLSTAAGTEAWTRAVQAWLACARFGSDADRRRTIELLAALDWSALGEAASLDAVRVLERALPRTPLDGERFDDLRAPVTATLVTALRRCGDPSGALGSRLVPLLVRLEASPVVGLALAALDDPDRRPTRAGIVGLLLALRSMPVGWTEATRERYFRALNDATLAFDGNESALNFLDAIRRRAIERLDASERAALGDLLVAPAPESTAPVATHAFVKAWTADEILSALAERTAPADAESLARGAELFRSATCQECHRIGPIGGADGPDLTGAPGRYDARAIVDAVLNPSVAVSDQYRDTEIWMLDGRMFVGTLLREDADSLTLLTRPPSKDEVRIEKREIELRRPTQLSRMPEGLFDSLELDEIADLIAYLLSEKD